MCSEWSVSSGSGLCCNRGVAVGVVCAVTCLLTVGVVSAVTGVLAVGAACAVTGVLAVGVVSAVTGDLAVGTTVAAWASTRSISTVQLCFLW